MHRTGRPEDLPPAELLWARWALVAATEATVAGGSRRPGHRTGHTLRELLDGYELGCVYWYENGTRARAPYPETLDDDGLDCGIGRFAVRGEVLGLLADRERAMPDGRAEELLRAAEAYRLTPSDVAALTGATGPDEAEGDAAARMRALHRAGLAPVALPAP
jgi:hypothetical protein